MADYYKLIKNNKIIGLVTPDNFRKYQSKHNMILYADIDTAQYVELNEIYYRDNWLRAITTDKIPYEQASIIGIDYVEYSIIKKALDINDSIDITPEQNNEEPPIEDDIIPTDEPTAATLEFVRNAKIAQMSKICHDTIVNGIDVILSDGQSHHFSLQIEDQIKIQALAMKAQGGEQTLFWHEDDKPCQFYSAADILKIYAALENIQTFETTWFNSLKMYIMSMDNIEQIDAVTYRTEIPIEYQGEVLRYLLSQQVGE